MKDRYFTFNHPHLSNQRRSTPGTYEVVGEPTESNKYNGKSKETSIPDVGESSVKVKRSTKFLIKYHKESKVTKGVTVVYGYNS